MCLQQPTPKKTYSDEQWARPRRNSAIPLDIERRLRLIINVCEPFELSGLPRRTSDILELEYDFDYLRDRYLRIVRSRTVMEPGTVDMVRRDRAVRVDNQRIGEVIRL